MKTPVTFALIVARGTNNVIGCQGTLPWHLSADMKFFKNLTSGCPIIMGRKTWESLPKRPLPKRENIVVTRNGAFLADRARVFTDIKVARATAESLALSNKEKYVFAIGGAGLYQDVISQVSLMFITEVAANPVGDVFFPTFESEDWKIELVLEHSADTANDYDFVINRYIRKEPSH